MVHETETAVTSRPWWDHALDPMIDFLEDYLVDPIDEAVTPRLERYQANTAHRLASRARRYAEIHAVRSWPFSHRTRARRLHAWASAESAVEHTRAGVHAQHTGAPDDSNGCCTPLIRLYGDRAELVRALAVMEEQSPPLAGREPNFRAMPTRIRRLAGDWLAAMSRNRSIRQRAEAAEELAEQLAPTMGAAVAPIRRVYIF